MTESKTKKSIQMSEEVFDRRLAAVDEAIDKYHTYIQNYLYGLTRQWQDAENLAQELWSYVLLRFDEDKIGHFPLLRRKAYQLFVDHYRRIVRRKETLSDTIPETQGKAVSPDAYTDEEELALKEKFWGDYPDIDLTDQQKEVLWLYARYGFTYKEIQEKTGVPDSTVGDWIGIARKRIAESINDSARY